MEKGLLFLVCCFWFVVGSYANDTLTRAQVYNFNVGDTFDYQVSPMNPCHPPPYYPPYYSRTIITSKYYSIAGDTLFYIRQLSGPSYMHTDTLILTNLQGIEVFLDSCTITNCYYNHFSFDSSSSYDNKPMNSLEYEVPFTNPIKLKFAEGLGLVHYLEFTTGGGCYTSYTIDLVYYSKGSETWGTPMYIYNSISEIQYPQFTLSPNPTTNQLTINSSAPIEQINIYNTTGQLVLQTKELLIDLSSLSKGVYVAEITPKSPKGDLNTNTVMRRWVKM